MREPTADADRRFFLAFVVVAWLAVVAGFADAVVDRSAGRADYPAPLILQLHVFLTTGWLLLLSVQVLLVRTRRLAWHATLGVGGLLLGIAVAISAIGAELESQRYYSALDPENLRFFIAPLTQVAIFVGCLLLAVLTRRDPATHKRLIVLATSALLVAASNRLVGQQIYEWLGDGYVGMPLHNFTGPTLLMLVAAAYDRITRGAVHRTYAIGIPVALGLQALASIIYHADAWPSLVRRIVGL
jgi:hypothetical protein